MEIRRFTKKGYSDLKGKKEYNIMKSVKCLFS